MADPPVLWRPNPGAQTKFLASSSFEALYGGAAGGGKSHALLMGALRHVDRPDYRALRRTYTELYRSLIAESYKYYPAAGGKSVMSPQPQWRFPSGAVIEFGHLQHDKDVHDYQSAQYQYMGFDELTHFTEAQYRYMLSRLRGDVPVRVRSGSNPGGEGHDWVYRRFAPWLNREPDYIGPRAAPGETMWYVNTENDGEVWVPRDTPGALSRVFVPARLVDNPYVHASYADVLNSLDRVDRARLRDGDWLARPAAGEYFKRHWFETVDAFPIEPMSIVRWWDRAATEKKPGKDPDWTVGLKMARTKRGMFFVLDVIRFQERPAEVERIIKATTDTDGRGVAVYLSRDPGSAGEFEADYYLRVLAGYDVHTERETGDKVTRSKPVSAQAEAKNVKLLKGAWNTRFLDELEQFPEGGHDDQVDAFSGAFSVLAPVGELSVGEQLSRINVHGLRL